MVSHAYPGPYAFASSARTDWSPYLAGFGIGVLSWIVFAVVNAPLGITTALSQVAGGAATPILGAETVAQNAYWAKNPFVLDYGTLFLVGTFFGGLASSVAAGTFRVESVPAVWRERFGNSVVKRYAAALLGGILVMYGARMAGGCTSGHGISGGLQLALSSWVFLAVMFASGLATAALLFRKPA
jgi:uncharacterized membrane protein YedE/YeeE